MSARDSALAVIRAALDREPALFVALQYCGMLQVDALAPLREQDARLIERILSVEPAPEPVYERQVRRRVALRAYLPADEVTELSREHMRRVGEALRSVPPIGGAGGMRVGGTRDSLFARWIEGEIEFHPSILGWADDDPRAEGYG